MRSMVVAVVGGVAALAVGHLVWLVFGVHAEATSYPPICANAFGRSVSCDHEGPAKVAGFLTALICWLPFLWLSALIGRPRAGVDRVPTP